MLPIWTKFSIDTIIPVFLCLSVVRIIFSMLNYSHTIYTNKSNSLMLLRKYLFRILEILSCNHCNNFFVVILLIKCWMAFTAFKALFCLALLNVSKDKLCIIITSITQPIYSDTHLTNLFCISQCLLSYSIRHF